MNDYDYVYIVITAGKSELRVVGNDGERIGLRKLQDGVGGLITIVPLAYASTALDGVDVFANDEGLLEELEPNIGATILTGIPIVGDIVICKSDEEGNSIAFEFQEGSVLARRLIQAIDQFLCGDSDIERFTAIPENILFKSFHK